MDRVLNKIRSKFLSELESENDLWRIYRKSTFVDLIVRDFLKFNNSQNPDLLLDIFNHVIKLRMLKTLDRIDLDEDFHNVSRAFGQNKDEITRLYNTTLDSVSFLLSELGPGDLHDNVLYLKVASNLNVDDYNERVFDELLSSIYSYLYEHLNN